MALVTVANVFQGHLRRFIPVGLTLIGHSLQALLLMLLVCLQSSSACKIPVFRYALERWSPDVYTLAVVHQGSLDSAAESWVEQLRGAAISPTTPCNYRVETYDLTVARADEALPPQETWLRKQFAELEQPQLVLFYPQSAGIAEPAWQGALTEESVGRLTNSPARRQVVDRILAGESAVWVLVESGDAAADDDAAATLQRELERMQETLRLPSAEELAAEEEFQSDTLVQLRIGFSFVRVARDNPAEEVFVATLLNSEHDLAGLEEPIAIPIFGRGRTYYALVGQGIQADTIEDNCRFICGDCSCQVKEQNPGVDMLMSVAWDTQVRGTALPDRELPALTGIGGLQIFDLDALEAQAAAKDESRRPPTASLVSGETAAPSAAAVVEHDEPAAVEEQPLVSEETSPTSEDPAAIGAGLLRWVLGFVVVAVIAVGASSIWMRSRSVE